MAAESSDTPANQRVIDEEGSVDQQAKRRIITARERVDEREDLLFVQPTVDPNLRFDRARATLAWGGTVRQYLRAIEPLLRSDRVTNATRYYEEVELGKEKLVPPDKDGKPFSKFADPSVDNSELMWKLGIPPDATAPTPSTHEFTGLKSVLDQEVLSETWSIEISKGNSFINTQHITLEARQPIPKRVLETAIREADNFLQQAGVGLEIGHKEKDEKEMDPF